MSYSSIVRALGAGAVVAALIATFLFIVGYYRGGAVIGLWFIACLTGVCLVMIRQQSRVNSTMLRGLGNRIERVQSQMSEVGPVLERQTAMLSDMDSRIGALETVPDSLSGMSGAIAATRKSVLEAAASQRYLADRTEKIREGMDALSKSTDSITVGVNALRSSSEPRSTAEKQSAPSSTSKVAAVRQPSSQKAGAETRVPGTHRSSNGSVRVLTLGRDPLESEIDGLRTVPLLPGAIPSRAALPASVVLMIDESGFSRGVWKSFGGEYDEFTLSELEAVRRLVGDGRIHVITLLAENTPVRFQLTRSWGLVASKPAEAEQHLRSAIRR